MGTRAPDEALAVMTVLWNLRYGFVITQSTLHQRNNTSQSLDRQGMKFVEADSQQHVDHALPARQGQLVQFSTNLVVILVNAEYPSNGVKLFRPPFQCRNRNLMPLRFEISLF